MPALDYGWEGLSPFNFSSFVYSPVNLIVREEVLDTFYFLYLIDHEVTGFLPASIVPPDENLVPPEDIPE